MSVPTPRVRFRRLRPDAVLPRYMTPGAAGLDLAFAGDGEIVVGAGERVAVPTGLAMELPAGYEAQIRPRSGLAIKHGITVANAPGTIDSDYRGEIQILLVNLGKQAHTFRPGDRVAQMVVAPVAQVEIEESDSLSGSERGDGGFGSTGRR